MLRVPYVSLVNLIAGREVVRELVAHGMTAETLRAELHLLLRDEAYRTRMLAGYDDVAARLGGPGAPERAARLMTARLRARGG